MWEDSKLETSLKLNNPSFQKQNKKKKKNLKKPRTSAMSKVMKLVDVPADVHC